MDKMRMVTQELADFVFQLAYDQVPIEVVEYAKSLIIDQLGVALAAVQTPVYRCAQELLKSSFGRGESEFGGMA